MPGRRGRPRLTMPRKASSRRAAGTSKCNVDGLSEDHLDEDESTVPDEAKWKTMKPYGLFAISDKDGVKYRFKRGDIATILPQQKDPNEQIEPHEYWIGKILEIRADAGSQDSTVIWAKVRWFYNAEDAAGIVKSLDTSRIGKFERLCSPHWDFVLPHTFNEVISMPQLHPYPLVKRKKSLTRKKQKLVDTESISTATTSTVVQDGGLELGLEDQQPIGPEMFYWRYTIDIVGRKINPKPELKSCLCSLPYSPDTTSLLQGAMFFCPRPTCRTSFHVGCLRGAKSVRVPDDQEVVVPTPLHSPSKSINRGRGIRRGSARGKGKEKAEVALEDDFTNAQWLTPRAIRRIACTPDSNDPVDLLSLLSPPSSLDTTSTPRKKHRHQTPPSSPLSSLLQRVYARQLQQHQREQTATTVRKCVLSATSKHSAPSIMSTKSGGSWIEVEGLLVTEDEDADGDIDVEMSGQHDILPDDVIHENNSTSWGGFTQDTISQLITPKSPHKSKPKSKGPRLSDREKDNSKHVQVDFPSTTHRPLQVKPLTPATLLATLFLLPSPFPPSYASATSSQPTATSIPSPSATPTAAVTSTTNNTASTSTNLPPVASTSKPTTIDDTSIDSKDLLLLASQPLLRGAGYIPYLGPTGNVNLVLAARRLIWEVLSALGGVELSSSSSATAAATTVSPTTASTTSKKRGRLSKNKSTAKGKTAPSPFDMTINDDLGGDERELDEAQQDIRDAEDYRKVLECVHSLLSGWKERFKEGGKVLPPGAEVDDGIVIKDGLILHDSSLSRPLPSGGKGSGQENEDIDMADGTRQEEETEVEEEGVLRSGKKRKRVYDPFSEVNGSRKKGKGKAKGKDREREIKGEEEEEEEEEEVTPEEEEMLLRVDWACPHCDNLL